MFMFMIEIEILLNDIWFDIGILYIDDSVQDCSKSSDSTTYPEIWLLRPKFYLLYGASVQPNREARVHQSDKWTRARSYRRR